MQQPMYFLDEGHRAVFFSRLEEKPSVLHDKERLVALYITSLPFFPEDQQDLFEFAGEWSGSHISDFEPTEAYKKLSRAEQMMVLLGFNLYNGNRGFDLMEALAAFSVPFRFVMEEAIRIRLMGMPETAKTEK